MKKSNKKDIAEKISKNLKKLAKITGKSQKDAFCDAMKNFRKRCV